MKKLLVLCKFKKSINRLVNEDGTISTKQGDEIPKDLEKYDLKEINLSEENI